MTDQLAWLFGEQTNQTWTRFGAVILIGSFGGGSFFGLTSIQVPESATVYWWLPLIYLFVPMLLGMLAGGSLMYYGAQLAKDRYRIEEEVRIKNEQRRCERVPMPVSRIEDEFMLAFENQMSPDNVRDMNLPDLPPREVLSVLAKMQVYRGRLNWDGEVYTRATPQDRTTFRG